MKQKAFFINFKANKTTYLESERESDFKYFANFTRKHQWTCH